MKNCLLKKDSIYKWMDLEEKYCYMGCKVLLNNEVWIVIKIYNSSGNS